RPELYACQRFGPREIPRSIHMVQTIQRKFRGCCVKANTDLAKSIGSMCEVAAVDAPTPQGKRASHWPTRVCGFARLERKLARRDSQRRTGEDFADLFLGELVGPGVERRRDACNRFEWFWRA